jgi:hypothetical protein
LRNGDNLIVPFCRLSITNSSFIPSTVKEWNKLDIAIRKLDSLSKFKNAIRLNSQSNKISVPKLYYYGPRKLNVILTQLRCTASFLNHDLYKFIFYLAQRVAAVPPKKMRNLDNESNFLIAMSSLLHSLTVEGINNELVIESLQKGTIKLSPFRKGYIVVL